MQFIIVCSPFPTLTNASDVSFVSGYSIPVNGSIRFFASGSDYIVRGLKLNFAGITLWMKNPVRDTTRS